MDTYGVHPDTTLKTGTQWVDGRQLSQLARALRLRPAGPNVRIVCDANGQTISVDEAGAGEELRWVVVTAAVAYNRYTVDVYDNYCDDAGTPAAAIDTGRTLWIPQIAATATLPVGTWVLAIKRGAHYEGQVPVWL